jgi:hypothetical protein
MITLTKEVVDTIHYYFPKKAESVLVSLDGYINDLDHAIFQSINASRHIMRYTLFDVSLSDLSRNTRRRVRYEGKMVDLHDWLLDYCPLFKVVSLGSKFKKTLSQITLTDKILYTDITMNDTTNPLAYTQYSENEFDFILTENSHSDIFKKLYPDLDLTNININDYDFTPVDLYSLRSYIKWIKTGAKYYSDNKKRKLLREANIVLQVSTYFNNNTQWGLLFPQRKKVSEFGRTYYRGISIQSVNKELRRAILGQSYYYDARSSAIAWKHKFAAEVKQLNPELTFEVTELYITDKNEFFELIMQDMKNQFDNSELNDGLYKSFKTAITAITFGARVTTGGVYFDAYGNIEYSAINKTIKNERIRDAFIHNELVIQFNKEQSALDKFIFEKYKSNPLVKQQKFLHSEKGILNKSKVVAYAYQQEETQYMNDIKFLISEFTNSQLLANIHDGIVVDIELSTLIHKEIEDTIKQKYNIPLFKLTLEYIKGFKPFTTDADIEEQKKLDIEYQEFKKQEEQNAKHKLLTQSFIFDNIENPNELEELAFANFLRDLELSE